MNIYFITQIDNPGNAHGDGGEKSRNRCFELFEPLKIFFQTFFKPSEFILIGNGSLESDYFMMANADYLICDKSYLTTFAALSNAKGEIAYVRGNYKGFLGNAESSSKIFGVSLKIHAIEYGAHMRPLLQMSTVNDKKKPMSMKETAEWVMTH